METQASCQFPRKRGAVFIDHVGPDSDYISRLKMEKLILSVCDNTDNRGGQYLVVYGPKGAGRSSLVARALAEKCGVIKISTSQGDTVDTIIKKILDTCQVQLDHSASLDTISRVLRDAASGRQVTTPDPVRPGEGTTVSRPPTPVLEVERGGGSADVLSLTRHVAKQFAIDSSVLFTLSEANAVLGFGGDRRQSFILVDEVTREEALELTRKIHPTILREDFDRFTENVGTPPLDVVNFARALRVSKSQDNKIIGSGVGLYMSMLIAKMHKGSIKVFSKGKGSSFVLEIPLQRNSSATEQSRPAPVRIQVSSKLQSIVPECADYNSSNQRVLWNEDHVLKVLIVDDSTVNCQILKRGIQSVFSKEENLRSRLIEYFTTDDGLTAISLAVKLVETENRHFDFIFMDSIMTFKDGPDTARELRNLHKFSGVIFGVTGNATKEQIEKYLAFGADEVLVKPVDRCTLLRKAIIGRLQL